MKSLIVADIITGNCAQILAVNMFPLPLNMYFEIAALLTAAIFWRGLKYSRLRWFLLFLLAIVLVEMTGRYYRKILHQPNTWLYNVSIPIEFLFYTFIFSLYIANKKFKKLIFIFLAAYPIFVTVSLLISGTYYLNILNVVVGNIAIIIFCCLYFYSIFNDEEKNNIFNDPMFWIASGVFLFWTGEFVFNLLFSLLKIQGMAQMRKLTGIINNNLILVLYTCISIGLIWEATKKKSTLQ